MNVCSHSTQGGDKGVSPLDRFLYFSGGSWEKGVRVDVGTTKKEMTVLIFLYIISTSP